MRLRRLIVALLAAPALLGGPVPAVAAESPARSGDLAALPALFAEALNGGPDARACDLLVDELRTNLANAESAGLDPYDAATWTSTGLAHACEHWVHEGIRSWDPGAWPDRTTVGTVRVVGARDGVAHLRVRVLKHRDDGPGLPGLVENVFAERGDDGAWRLAYVGRLLDLYEHTDAFVFLGPERSEDLIVPRRLGDYAAFRRQQIRVEQLRLAKRRREVRAFAAARTAVGAAPRRCAGARVAGRRAGVRRPPRPATLHVEPRALCWTLRFESDVPRRLGLETDAEQRVRVVRGPRPRLLGLGARLGVQVRDGTAAGWVAGGNRQTFTRVRAGVRGRTLVVRMPRSALRGQVEADRRVRWKLTTFPVGASLDELRAGPDASAAQTGATPATVLHRFAEAIDRGDGAAACRTLTADLVALRHYPEHVGLHSLAPSSWTRAAVLDGCGAEWDAPSGRERGPRVAVRQLRSVARHGGVVHVRLRVLVGRRVNTPAVAFVVRERGAWRIAALSGPITPLPTNGSTEPREREPVTFAQFAGYRRDLARDLRQIRREQARRVRAFERVRTPIARAPLACASEPGPTSRDLDLLHDVAWSPAGLTGRPNPISARGDIRAARLTRTATGLCLTVELRAAVPDPLSVGLQLTQRHPRGFTISQSLGVELLDGWAFSTEDRGEGRRVFRRAEAAAVGNTVTVAFPDERLPTGRFAVRLDRPLRWTATTTQYTPWPPAEGAYREDVVGPAPLRP